jgi:tetratricopeptide (TPR) repeat protein
MAFSVTWRAPNKNETQAPASLPNTAELLSAAARDTQKPSVETVRADPQEVNHRSVGDKHRDLKQWREAAAAYTRHLELYPEDDAIWIQCGNCLKEAGDFARSLAAYKEAEKLNATNFDVHLQLGHLNKITGRLSEALRCYQQAALLNPDFGEAKHEIQNLIDRMNSVSGRAVGETTVLFSSVDQVIAFLKLQSEDDDVFASYFRSVSGR